MWCEMPKLADLPRKNCWTLAEHAGDARPDGMQHLLGRAVWDHDGCGMTCTPMWSSTWATPRRVLIIDENGDLTWPVAMCSPAWG
jgi:hypothetical protein